MSEPHQSDATIRALNAEFPGWSFVHTDTGRYWAMRTGFHVVSELIADTADILRAQLRELMAAEVGR